MKEISLLDLTQCALLLPMPTGIKYTQQCGGTACLQREMEGVLAPINHDYPLDVHTESLECKIMAFFPSGNPGYITEENANGIQILLNSSNTTKGITVNTNKLTESVESWVYVNVSGEFGLFKNHHDTEAVLTWPNSD